MVHSTYSPPIDSKCGKWVTSAVCMVRRILILVRTWGVRPGSIYLTANNGIAGTWSPEGSQDFIYYAPHTPSGWGRAISSDGRRLGDWVGRP